MYCPKCGQENPDGSTQCSSCGAAFEQTPEVPIQAAPNNAPYSQPTPSSTPFPQSAPPQPDNFLVWSILTTIFCCLPLGIVSIVFAAQVSGLYAGGNYAGAEDAAKKAKTWAWASFGVGLAGMVIYVVFLVIAGIASQSGMNLPR